MKLLKKISYVQTSVHCSTFIHGVHTEHLSFGYLLYYKLKKNLQSQDILLHVFT